MDSLPRPLPSNLAAMQHSKRLQRLEIVGHLLDLFGRDADGAVERNAGAGEQRGEQVALIALGVGQEASRVDRAAAFAGDDEGQVFAGVLVAVLEAGAPHHDAVVEQRAVAFAEAGHLLHHVGELGDVERGDRGDFRDLAPASLL